ncbi:MAG: hypothetical protein LBQ33_00120 [Oscillospiraceae bacterium]|jgi:hypothetical protein|nr:hypothetical protein [Oscillospiraceae bacterium]
MAMKRQGKTAGLLVCCLLCISTLFSCNGEVSSGKETSNADAAYAYYAVFEKLYSDDAGLNGGQYLAVDFEESMLENKNIFIALMQRFCAEHNYILLLDTFDGLEEKGYIKDLYFEDGLYISFDDTTLTSEKLVTAAKKWRSALGAIGFTFTVKKRLDGWQITDEADAWIS